MADIKFGASGITTLKFGSAQVDRVYLGADLVWQNASISASPNPATKVDFVAEPAPDTRNMSVSTTLSGTGLTSATWAFVSGNNNIAVTPGANGMSATFSASVLKNSGGVVATFQATGNHGLSVLVDVSLRYDTNL